MNDISMNENFFAAAFGKVARAFPQTKRTAAMVKPVRGLWIGFAEPFFGMSESTAAAVERR
jgi:hypothetical protein